MYPQNNDYLSKQGPKSVDIVEQIRKKGTFDITPDDENFIRNAVGQGFTEAQIVKGIEAKKKISSDNQVKTVDPNAPNVPDVTTETTGTTQTIDPFKGKTREQFLKDAFLGGVTSFTELEKLGKTYDLLATSEDASGMDTNNVDGQAAVKQTVEKTAIEKMQALPDATGRDSALSALSTFRTGDDIIKTLESGKVKTGLAEGGLRQGIFGVGGRSLGFTSKEEDSFAALTEVFAANFRKALSGTAVAEGEMRRLDKFLPSETKTKQQNIEGVKALANYLSDKTSLQLGYDVSPLIPSETGDDPLNLFKGGASKKNQLGI